MEKKKQRVTFYVDGYNFYYGLRRTINRNELWTRQYYWLDMVKFFESFLGDNQRLEKVIYFTATPLNPQKKNRQGVLFNANKFLNGNRFEIVRGKFLENWLECPFCHSGILKPEEKKTDVNISVRMMENCAQDRTDVVVLVSADCDLVPPLESIHKYHPEKFIKVFCPPSNHSDNLYTSMKRIRVKITYLLHNQRRFDDAVMDSKVGKYTVPEKWAS